MTKRRQGLTDIPTASLADGQQFDAAGTEIGPSRATRAAIVGETLGSTPLGSFSPSAGVPLRISLERRSFTPGGGLLALTEDAWVLGIEIQYVALS